MANNFNFAPTPTKQSESWNDDWSSTPADILPHQNDWSSDSFGGNNEPLPATQAESGRMERIRELKDKAVQGIGRKALDAVMNRLPSFGGGKDIVVSTLATAYEDPLYRQAAHDTFSDVRTNFGGYQEQVSQYAMSAGREVAGAGVSAAKEAVMTYYGLEKDENEKLRVARKLKFGKAVVKTVMNPVGTASSVGVRAGHAARKAVKTEGYSQIRTARSSAMESASNYGQTPIPALESWDDWGPARAA